MSVYEIWMIIGWSIPVIIIGVCAWLAYGLYSDAQSKASRTVAAPTLGNKETENVFGNDTGFASRADRKKKKKSSTVNLRTENTSSSSLWAESNDNFDLSSGKD